ncbi:hypothetical protein SAMN05660748_2817 [Blastococcus aggregatus]|uniref:Uncharacterized protein n=1 Tax=Blastococcus aggregatus TaxID=38502 RepID=A0A285V920_9ACTN|nr:hypothetical protein [Blastococcus aggregatus]SOC50078.1 hypothetical protein SAMN05660748_2817 [Blastococcus aggregatus]
MLIDEAVSRFPVLPLLLGLGVVLPWSAWADLGWRGPALVVGVLLRRLPAPWAQRRPRARTVVTARPTLLLRDGRVLQQALAVVDDRETSSTAVEQAAVHRVC